MRGEQVRNTLYALREEEMIWSDWIKRNRRDFLAETLPYYFTRPTTSFQLPIFHIVFFFEIPTDLPFGG